MAENVQRFVSPLDIPYLRTLSSMYGIEARRSDNGGEAEYGTPVPRIDTESLRIRSRAAWQIAFMIRELQIVPVRHFPVEPIRMLEVSTQEAVAIDEAHMLRLRETLRVHPELADV
jgi:hypothetical protein